MIRYKMIIILALLILVATGCQYSTLDEAIQDKWSNPIEILLTDEENETVIFESDDQYIFNTYQTDKQKYSYSTAKEVGVSVKYLAEHPMLVINSFDDDAIGNIIWGVIGSHKQAEMVDITITKRGSLSDKIAMNLTVENNVFVGYPPVQFFDSEVQSNWLIQAKAYDRDGKLIVETEI